MCSGVPIHWWMEWLGRADGVAETGWVDGSPAGSDPNPTPGSGSGYIRDPDVDLYFGSGHRPKVGKFLSEDPIEFGAGDPNLYRLTANDPINWIDPERLRDWLGRIEQVRKDPIGCSGRDWWEDVNRGRGDLKEKPNRPGL